MGALMMKRRWGRWGLALLVMGVLAGCASGRAVREARVAVDEARNAGAEQKAPYAYTAAAEYLEMAQHEYDELDCKAALEFAQKSSEFSAQALQQAKGGAQ